ncbi:MAG: tRNA(His) guanylyltransferase Thg1 family protein [Cyclobacteriaceae bacterium]
MKFDELDSRMRVFETNYDVSVMPDVYMVARIDGRGFTRLTKEKHNFQKPFDETFRDYMIKTTKHLMVCGFKVVYGYTQSDEISLLFDANEDTFSRKVRKYNSILAAEASAKFSLLLNDLASFDCRISQLPGKQNVVDYFSWRNEDAHRNALNAHCYWLLRKEGRSAGEATKEIKGKSNASKNELLFRHGLNFNDLPKWQKRGVGLQWESYEKAGWNPVEKKQEVAIRKKIVTNMELPMKDEYDKFIQEILDK